MNFTQEQILQALESDPAHCIKCDRVIIAGELPPECSGKIICPTCGEILAVLDGGIG